MKEIGTMVGESDGLRRLNYDEELRLYEKIRINYSHIISEPRNDTETILNSIFSKTSLVRLWDKITIDTEHPFPGNSGITVFEARRLENGMKFLSLYGASENQKVKNEVLLDVMKKTDPELMEEIITTSKRVLNDIKEKYRFEIVNMHQKEERSVEQDLKAPSYSRNPEQVFSLILLKNADLLRKEDFMEVFKRMKIYSVYEKLNQLSKGNKDGIKISQEEIEKLIYALQFLKFLYLVRTEDYGTREILRFDKFLKRATDIHPEWLSEIDQDYHTVLKNLYGKKAGRGRSQRK